MLWTFSVTVPPPTFAGLLTARSETSPMTIELTLKGRVALHVRLCIVMGEVRCLEAVEQVGKHALPG